MAAFLQSIARTRSAMVPRYRESSLTARPAAAIALLTPSVAVTRRRIQVGRLVLPPLLSGRRAVGVLMLVHGPDKEDPIGDGDRARPGVLGVGLAADGRLVGQPRRGRDCR